jgi:hypothetical protein
MWLFTDHRAVAVPHGQGVSPGRQTTNGATWGRTGMPQRTRSLPQRTLPLSHLHTFHTFLQRKGRRVFFCEPSQKGVKSSTQDDGAHAHVACSREAGTRTSNGSTTHESVNAVPTGVRRTVPSLAHTCRPRQDSGSLQIGWKSLSAIQS